MQRQLSSNPNELFDRPSDEAYGNLPGKVQNEQEIVKPPAGGADALQFAFHEATHHPALERCRICDRSIQGVYYRVNDQRACPKCAGEARHGQPLDSHAALVRGLVLGGAAAMLSLILYAAIQIAVNFYFGYTALAVGWLVSKAILKGSNGIGGRNYQIAAVLLTYAAISLAGIPIRIAGVIQHNSERSAQVSHPAPLEANPAGGGNTSIMAKPRGGAKRNFRRIAMKLLAVGLASPFLEWRGPWHGLLAILVLLVSLRIAFRLSADGPLDVDGPYGGVA